MVSKKVSEKSFGFGFVQISGIVTHWIVVVMMMIMMMRISKSLNVT